MGTRALATAWIIFEPCLITPSCSDSVPTMKPVVLCRNSSGTLPCSQSWMNCAALAAPWGVMGPLLPIRPQGRPSIRRWPQTVWLSNSFLKSRNSDPSAMRAMISRTS
ncbi:hypothetical protein D3C76_1259040 [compost metagenome]